MTRRRWGGAAVASTRSTTSRPSTHLALWTYPVTGGRAAPYFGGCEHHAPGTAPHLGQVNVAAACSIRQPRVPTQFGSRGLTRHPHRGSLGSRKRTPGWRWHLLATFSPARV